MTLELLQTAWYGIIAISILFYAVLDGFDLGVGALHLFARGDDQRRIFLNSIGPFWDGNEVWIVIMMGGLFAGFPNAYATIFSGFYSLLMFLIAGLIFRAVAIEFRSKRPSPSWRSFWDLVFSGSSILVSLVMGLVLGNMILGVPLNSSQDFVGQFSDFFNFYTISVAITATSLFAMHGTIYLCMKTEGETHAVVRRWVNPAIMHFFFWYAVTTCLTILNSPHMLDRFHDRPFLGIFPVLALITMMNIPRQIAKNNDGWAFISSCATIGLLLILFGLGTFPTIVYSTLNPDTNSLTIYNSSSGVETLKVLLIIVAIGVPLVLAYGVWIYHIFRGKVRLDKMSY